MRSSCWRCFLIALVATSCSARVVTPPTPASKLSPAELLASQPPPNERFFVLLFGSQTTPRIPRYTHTWATVVKVSQPQAGGEPKIESHTISWLPDSNKVRIWRICVEPGSNREL